MMMASPSDACTYSDDQFVMGGCIVKYVNIVLVHKVNGVQAFGVKMCSSCIQSRRSGMCTLNLFTNRYTIIGKLLILPGGRPS